MFNNSFLPLLFLLAMTNNCSCNNCSNCNSDCNECGNCACPGPCGNMGNFLTGFVCGSCMSNGCGNC